MKVKHHQFDNHSCGLCAIKNLLNLYQIKEKININVSKLGLSLYEVSSFLQVYFKHVKVVEFDIENIKKIKEFSPFIALISTRKVNHYVVIYKKDEKYVYVLDSLYLFSYKTTYKRFAKKYTKIGIIVQRN